jgi:SOS-response transcriptional repressor LexA
MDSIGNRIKTLRKASNLTQFQLGELIGKSKGNISGYENGTYDPSASTIIELAKCFNISTDSLLFGGELLNKNNAKIEFNVNEKNLYEYFNLLKAEHKARILERVETFLEEYDIEIYDVYESTKTENSNFDKINESDSSSYTSRVSESKGKVDVITKHLPILGQTAAGPPIDIVEVGGGDYIEVPKSVDADYALFVKGDSMEPIIHDKDLVYIKSMPEVENGTIIVADVDGTVTCKKIHRYNGKVELISLNKDYDPIIINTSDNKYFRIIGKVAFCQRPNSNFFAI